MISNISFPSIGSQLVKSKSVIYDWKKMDFGCSDTFWLSVSYLTHKINLDKVILLWRALKALSNNIKFKVDLHYHDTIRRQFYYEYPRDSMDACNVIDRKIWKQTILSYSVYHLIGERMSFDLVYSWHSKVLETEQKFFKELFLTTTLSYTGCVKILFQGGSAVISNSMSNEFYTKWKPVKNGI